MDRHLACAQMNLRNDELHFIRNENGKPYIKNAPNFHYNISHSGRWALCAISAKEIGADIEQMKPINMEVLRRIATDREIEAVEQKTGQERDKAFYTLWTAKESYLKYLGLGIFDLLRATIPPKYALHVPIFTYSDHFSLDSDYVYSICSEEDSLACPVLFPIQSVC